MEDARDPAGNPLERVAARRRGRTGGALHISNGLRGNNRCAVSLGIGKRRHEGDESREGNAREYAFET